MAWLFWLLPGLLIWIEPGARVSSRGLLSLIPILFVSQGVDNSLPWFVFQNAGPLVFTLSLATIALSISRRLRGWHRLVFVFAVFWAALLLLDAVLVFAQGYSGPLTRLLQLVALADFGVPAFGISLAIAAAALVLTISTRLLRRVHRENIEDPKARVVSTLSLFVVPVAALNWYQSGMPVGGGFWQLGLSYGPTLVAAVAGVTSLRRFRPTGIPLQLGAIEAVIVVSMAVAAYFGVVYISETGPSREIEVRFDEHQSRYWDLRFEQGAFTPAQRQQWGEAANRRLEDLAARLGIPLPANKHLAYVHITTDSKRTLAAERRTDSPSFIDLSTGVLHHLLAVDGSLGDPRGEAHMLLRQAWGKPGSWDIAQAISRYGASHYLHNDLAEYGRRITCEERHYTLSKIFSLDGEYLSPIVRDVLGGLWIKSRLDAVDPSERTAILRAIYRSTPDALFDRAGAQWEQDWEAYIDTLPYPDRPEPHVILHRNHKGITFTHEFRNGWGYGSDMAGKQLHRIHGLGGTAIALVPYASFSTPPRTEFRFRLSESDERVVRSIDQAHAAGLQVMLKPQLWGRIFTGDIKYKRREDFEVWFRRYRRWILHFARMAELHSVELFCIGNELNGVSGHEQHWRALIRDVRRIYNGPLTFAANWNEEFEQIAFWDDLDYLGVNFYFPLAERGAFPSATSPRLQELTADLEAMHRRYGKPILFTEVGYPPLATAAAEPWKETRAAFDHDLQKRCYETVFEAFSGKPWFAGMYWWKWPSHGQGSAFAVGHNPIGKPALDVLRDWYGRPSPATQ